MTPSNDDAHIRLLDRAISLYQVSLLRLLEALAPAFRSNCYSIGRDNASTLHEMAMLNNLSRAFSLKPNTEGACKTCLEPLLVMFLDEEGNEAPSVDLLTSSSTTRQSPHYAEAGRRLSESQRNGFLENTMLLITPNHITATAAAA